jgi:hypothetical protein
VWSLVTLVFARAVANKLRTKQAELMSFAVERIDCISTVILNGKVVSTSVEI